MRLSGKLKEVITSSITGVFGSVEAVLFGSRTDDYAVGGDIDIAVKTEMKPSEFRKNKIIFLTSLIRQNFDIKIDLVQYNSSMDSVLKKEIKQSGITL